MVYAITAAANLDGVSVNLTVTTLAANTATTITAVTAYGSYVVRATLPKTITASVVVRDPYAPFGTPITYQLRAFGTSGGTVQTNSAPFTLTGTSSVLTDSGLGSSIPVTVVTQAPRSWQGRSVFYDVISRRAPIVATQPARLVEGSLVIRCETLTTRNQLRDLLSGGYPLVLRSPYPDAIDDVTFLPTQWDEDQANPSAGPYTMTMRYQAVSVETTPYLVNSTTYAALALDARAPTYTSLPSVWATYALLALG